MLNYTERLLGDLRSKDVELRRKAVVRIGDNVLPEFVEPLIEALEHDEDTVVALKATEALGRSAASLAIAPLIRALGREDKEVRRAAYHAFFEMNNPAKYNALGEAFIRDQDVRMEVARVLTRLKNREAVDQLLPALTFDNQNVRRHATKALLKMGHEIRLYLEQVKPDPAFSSIVISILEKLPREAPKTMFQIFKLLPKLNCGECGVPTCLAFAMNVASGKQLIYACPSISDDVRDRIAESQARRFSQHEANWIDELLGKTIEEQLLSRSKHWRKLRNGLYWASFFSSAGCDMHTVYIFVFLAKARSKVTGIKFQLISENLPSEVNTPAELPKDVLSRLYSRALPPTDDLRDDIEWLVEKILVD